MRQRVEEPAAFDEDSVMAGRERLGDDVGVAELVALFAVDRLESHRKGRQVLNAGLGDKAGDETRIEPAGQQHPNRHVGNQPSPDRLAQPVKHHRAPFLARTGFVLGGAIEGEIPVAGFCLPAVRLDDHQRRRRQLANLGKNGMRGRNHGMERHVVMQRDRIDLCRDAAAGEERRQGGGEAHAAPPNRIVERLDAKTVAAQDEAAGLPFTQGKGEHAVEPSHRPGAPGMPCLQDDLGIAVGEEAISLRRQLVAQFTVIVDAAVEDDLQAQLGIGHWLLRLFRKVNDLQAAVSESHRPVGEQSFRVRAAGRHGVRHGFDRRPRGPRAVERHLATNSTHEKNSGLGGWPAGKPWGG